MKYEEELQYLDQGDLQRYLDALLAHADHFQSDHAYLPVFHGEHLTKQSGDKKKDTEYVLENTLLHSSLILWAQVQETCSLLPPLSYQLPRFYGHAGLPPPIYRPCCGQVQASTSPPNDPETPPP